MVIQSLKLSYIFGADNGLQSLKDELKNTPPNWVGADPCGGNWVGINCNNSRVTSM
jgi:hypothetical protein